MGGLPGGLEMLQGFPMYPQEPVRIPEAPIQPSN